MRVPFRSLLTLSVIVSLTMVSWLVAANHCAISGWQSVAAVAAESHVCCPGEDDPLPTPGMQMFCGDELTSPLPPALIAPATVLHALKPAWMEAGLLLAQPVAIDLRSAPDGSPPGGASFVEHFLTRRLLSHAPPARVA